MKWFKHQSDSLNSPFIQLLLDKFEAQGYLAFYGLRESIASEVGSDPLKKVSFSPSFLRRKLRISSSKLEQIFRFCITNGELLGNFSKEKWEFQDCKLLELKDNYSKDLQGSCKKLAHHKEVEVEEEVDIEVKKKKEPKSFSSDSNEIRLSELLLNFIRQRNPNHKQPNIQGWAKDIDRMIRLDKRPVDEVERVLKWCQTDFFWKNNILSTSALREKFDQLALKMNSTKGGPTNGRFTGLDEKDYHAGTW